MKRAKHNLSNYNITAGDFGKLYPFSCTEILPGDTFRCSSSALIRLQPLMTPLMHPVDISIASFFVPNRLVDPLFEGIITGRDTGTIPRSPGPSVADSTPDYMGLPVGSTSYNAYPCYSYNLIWNEFYRDQDLDTLLLPGNQQVQHVRWNKDYFTAARPQPQQGGAVGASITFADDVPIGGIGAIDGSTAAVTPNDLRQTDGTVVNGRLFGNDQGLAILSQTGTPTLPNVTIPAGSVGGTVDINEWRTAMALQKYREARNKFGNRYKDYLSYLGVQSGDARLDRPEYLGGGRQTISFSEVLQTTETEAVPLGTQGGHGIAAIRTKPWKRMFQEHGHVISLMHIRPKTVYSNAQDRNWARQTTQDYWQKEQEVLGEQAILNREVYATHASQDGIFGYSPRHDDYRTQRSFVSGPMRRTEYSTWHMARDLSSAPALNSEFVKCEPTKRIFRSQQDPQFYAMVQNRIAARRLVSKYARN